MRYVLLVIVLIVAHYTNSDPKLPWNRTNFPKFTDNGTMAQLTKVRVEKVAPEGKSVKKCLENLEQCTDEATTEQLSNFLLASTPPFDFSNISSISPLCRIQSMQYIESLKNFKFWALQMYDSTAKQPSGILNGNVNQLGDFDMCLQARDPRKQIHGQYCLASLQLKTDSASPYVTALHNLVQSHYHFRSELDDPGHRVPKFSSINWALCVPSACSAEDVETAVASYVSKIAQNTGFDVKINVKPYMCQTGEQTVLPMSTIIASCIFLGVVAVAIVAAIYDYCVADNQNEWVTAFSLLKNAKSLISVPEGDDIEGIHSVRFLNAFLLIVAHKSMAVFFIPYVNRTYMVERLSQPWTVISRAASLYTDPFIMVSGTLTAHSILGKLQRTGKINVLEEYSSRLLRIVPTFAALIAFCTFILPWIGSGPMWNAVVTYHSDICKKYWWRNLLFIHNYFGFKNMCLTHTHHVGIDTQLFFISPILIYILWKWPRKGAYTLCVLALVSTVMRYYVTYSMKLSNYIHFGTSIKQLFDTADNMYILPAHRATVYIMGIFLGYILRYFREVPLTKLNIGNTVAFLSFLAAFCGPSFMGSINYVYNPTDAAWYAAFAPILWCFTYAWIIYLIHLGYKVPVLHGFFSCRLLSLWTKISYTVYLTQFPIFFFNVGVLRAPVEYKFFPSFIPLYEYGVIIFCSICLTLLFEMPVQNIRKILFKKRVTKVDKIHLKVS